ncbi:MAG: chemotaxis protein CheV [Pseudomonadota bacterium]|nr:chemotaxis protein CheV [Pseudomonadota bacterium]
MKAHKSELLEVVEAKTRLAGSNKMEILLFSLGSQETFGINVFKIREVSRTPHITKTPNMPTGVEGVISLRGNIIPVISLEYFVKQKKRTDSLPSYMIVAEYNKRTLAFLVHAVDRIVRVDWEDVRPPEGMLSDNSSMITAVITLSDGRLISLLHVEQILAQAMGEPDIPELSPVEMMPEEMIFVADDSAVARKEIASVLDRMNVRFQIASTGREAWEKLKEFAARAQATGMPLRQQIRLILTDAEMPEMDGYVLTGHIKNDYRFEGIPVIMHSSLSSEANKDMGKQAGVDAYVAKFDAAVLAETIRPFL